MYQVTRKLLSIPVVLFHWQAAKDAELLMLRHENAVLRRQLPRAARYEPVDRLWFAVLSSLIPRPRWAQVFPVTPGTSLAWHRSLIARRWDHSTRRSRPRRPPTAKAIRKLVLWLTKENPQPGCHSIEGELARRRR